MRTPSGRHIPFIVMMIATAALFALTAVAQEKRAFSLPDMFEIDRLGDPRLSPDGKNVLFVVTDVLVEENRTNSDIWMVHSSGGPPKLFASSP